MKVQVFPLHQKTITIDTLVSKLLKLPTDRFVRLKQSYVKNNTLREIAWNRAIIQREIDALTHGLVDHIETSINKETWEKL